MTPPKDPGMEPMREEWIPAFRIAHGDHTSPDCFGCKILSAIDTRDSEIAALRSDLARALNRAQSAESQYAAEQEARKQGQAYQLELMARCRELEGERDLKGAMLKASVEGLARLTDRCRELEGALKKAAEALHSECPSMRCLSDCIEAHAAAGTSPPEFKTRRALGGK